jgi:hypothetical protein
MVKATELSGSPKANANSEKISTGFEPSIPKERPVRQSRYSPPRIRLGSENQGDKLGGNACCSKC